jgi:hypothetical protein
VTVILISLSGLLGLFFLWGLVSPRSQWYALVGWTRADPRSSEPSSGAYGVGRFVSLIGLLALLTIAVSWGVGAIDFDQGDRERPRSEAERVWGSPTPYVVDRVFTPLSAPQEVLVPQPINGYQIVIPDARRPEYLFESGKIRQAGLATVPGFIGVVPLPGTVALDTADVVVHVRGDDRCIPQQVTVIGADNAVQVGVFFGRPDPADGSGAAQLGNCDPAPPIDRARAFLIPIDLSSPLAGRELQALDGTPIPLVPLP